MSLITREIINKNLTVTSLKLSSNSKVEKYVTSYDQLIKMIDQVKHYFIYEKNCQVGQKIIICNFYWPEYLACFFACTELGLIFVVSDYPKNESALEKLTVYGEIDYIIFDDHYPTVFNKFPEKLINSNLIFQEIIDPKKTPILVKPNDIVMLSTSSGTTGTPKVLSHTHEFFYQLLHRNAKLYSLKSNDRCFHSKGLHHGSVTGVYFLPSIRYCENHYHAPFKFTNDFNWFEIEEPIIREAINLIQSEGINKCLVFYDQLNFLVNYLDISKKKQDDLLIFVLSKVTREQIDVIVRQFNYRIASIFGCTETSGPLFLPEINPSNYKTFDLINFGKPLDDFYKINIDDQNRLFVTMPDSKIIVTGDKFNIENNEFIFQGRENLYRIKGKTLYLDHFNDVLENMLNLKKEIDFDIVIDVDHESIYIRLDRDIDLTSLNKKLVNDLGFEYFISKKIIGPRNSFYSGIKFDPESIRIICRQI